MVIEGLNHQSNLYTDDITYVLCTASVELSMSVFYKVYRVSDHSHGLLAMGAVCFVKSDPGKSYCTLYIINIAVRIANFWHSKWCVVHLVLLGSP